MCMKRVLAIFELLSFAGLSLPAAAILLLQLYIEGATYGSDLEGWPADGNQTVRVWAIGNVAGPGSKGTMRKVRMAIV